MIIPDGYESVVLSKEVLNKLISLQKRVSDPYDKILREVLDVKPGYVIEKRGKYNFSDFEIGEVRRFVRMNRRNYNSNLYAVRREIMRQRAAGRVLVMKLEDEHFTVTRES